MTIEERTQVVEELFKDVLAMASQKGMEYSGAEDSLANFKRNASNLGLTKYQVWAVYFGKHIDAIMNAVKRCPAHPESAFKSEPMRGRIVDALVYLTILAALTKEDAARIEAEANA